MSSRYDVYSDRKKNDLLRDPPSTTNSKCDFIGCQKKYRNDAELKDHYKLVHRQIETVESNKCNQCGNYFRTKGERAEHETFYSHR